MDDFHLELSKQDIKDRLGISFTRYYDAIRGLRKAHYLCEDYNGRLHFFTYQNPDFGIIQNWDSKDRKPKKDNSEPFLENVAPISAKIVPKPDIEINNINNNKFQTNNLFFDNAAVAAYQKDDFIV